MKNSLILTVFPIAILAFLNTHAQYTLNYAYDAGGNRQGRTTGTASCKTGGDGDDEMPAPPEAGDDGEMQNTEDQSPKSKVPNSKENAITDDISGSGIVITPNPSGSGKFRIVLQSANFKFSIANLSIQNTLGQEVYQSVIYNQQSEIDMSSQPKGVYFIKIFTGEEVYGAKIVFD